MAEDSSPRLDLEEFRAACRRWMHHNLEPRGTDHRHPDQTREARLLRARTWQAKVFDAGLAGITFPSEYGGQGLTPEHLQVFTEESSHYDVARLLAVPSIGVLGATLLDCGNEAQKGRHLPAILRGDELWVQLLSEPTGGSDLAGVRTRADRHGDEFILNGSKIWTTNGAYADYGLCLARTDSSLPKHAGLTMFIVPLRAPGVEVAGIPVARGDSDFCQEFFDDVRIPLANVVGTINGGWSVATTLLIHERDTVGGNSRYANVEDEGIGDETDLDDIDGLAQIGAARGHPDPDSAMAEVHIRDYAHRCLVERVTWLIASGEMPPVGGALLKLSSALYGNYRDDVAFELAGVDAVLGETGNDAPVAFGLRYLMRQAMCLAGGSNEMQRNLISERLLGMPRDRQDLSAPFNEIPSGPPAATRDAKATTEEKGR